MYLTYKTCKTIVPYKVDGDASLHECINHTTKIIGNGKENHVNKTYIN